MKKIPEITIALAGNPNSGKTSLFNALTGAHQKVGNWSGVTIEKYAGVIRYKGYKITIVDLPGTYSLTAYSPEEVVARNFLIETKPVYVINVVDGTNLERNLYLTTQLMELGVPMVLALNMYDEVRSLGIKIDVPQLEKLLDIRVIPTQANNKTGVTLLLDTILHLENLQFKPKVKLWFSEELETHIEMITKLLSFDKELQSYSLRWLAIKLLENDQQVYALLKERATWLRVQPYILNVFQKASTLR